MPANQDLSVSVHAAKGLLYYPAPRLESLLSDVDPFLATAWDVRGEAMIFQPAPDPLSFISSIEADVLTRPALGLWSLDRDAQNGIDHQLGVMSIGRRDDDPNRNTLGVSQDAALCSLLASICRVCACFFEPAMGAFAKLASKESQCQLMPLTSSYL